MKNTRNLKIIITIFSCLLLSYLIVSLFNNFTCSDILISELNVGINRFIKVTADSCWEVSRNLYYEVVQNSVVVSKKSRFDGDNGNNQHNYYVVYSNNKSLVGLIELVNNLPNIAAIYDFSSGESWPRLKDNELFGDYAVRRKWQNIFRELQKENFNLHAPYYLLN